MRPSRPENANCPPAIDSKIWGCFGGAHISHGDRWLAEGQRLLHLPPSAGGLANGCKVVTIERHFSARNAPYAPSIAINLLKSQQNDAPSERATTSLSKSYEWYFCCDFSRCRAKWAILRSITTAPAIFEFQNAAGSFTAPDEGRRMPAAVPRRSRRATSWRRPRREISNRCRARARATWLRRGRAICRPG